MSVSRLAEQMRKSRQRLQVADKRLQTAVTAAQRSELKVARLRRRLREKLREWITIGVGDGPWPSCVDLKASVDQLRSRIELVEAGERLYAVVAEELAVVTREFGITDVPGGELLVMEQGKGEPFEEFTVSDPKLRATELSTADLIWKAHGVDPLWISAEEATKFWERLDADEGNGASGANSDRLDQIQDFFERTGSSIDVYDSGGGGMYMDRERRAEWRAIWNDTSDDMFTFVSTGAVGAWVRRPEASKFVRRFDSHAHAEVHEQLRQLARAHPEGIDVERSVERALGSALRDVLGEIAPRAPANALDESEQKARKIVTEFIGEKLTELGVLHVDGGAVVPLVAVRDFARHTFVNARKKPEIDLDHARRVARELIWPPSLSSARNLEVAVMAATEFNVAIGMLGERSPNRNPEIRATLLGPEFSKPNMRVVTLLRHMGLMTGPVGSFGFDASYDGFLDFSWKWRCSTFARLEVGHKLAASLCLTDVHDLAEKGVDVRAPWEAWSLVVLDQLLGDAARVWLVGTDPQFLVRANGKVEPWATAALTDADRDMLVSLAIGSCLALSNPDEFKKEGAGARNGSTGAKRKRGEPEQIRYLLSAPVTIDLRERVAEARRSGGGGPMKVQSLTRGHWRNQAWGPRHSLRRPTWIRPFFRGGETAAMLLRTHQVEE